jgi:hypothetical protein
MKKTNLLAVTALTIAFAGMTIYLLRKDKDNKHKRRLTVISDAGYETAYDIHYPVKYRRGRSAEI